MVRLIGRAGPTTEVEREAFPFERVDRGQERLCVRFEGSARRAAIQDLLEASAG